MDTDLSHYTGYTAFLGQLVQLDANGALKDHSDQFREQPPDQQHNDPSNNAGKRINDPAQIGVEGFVQSVQNVIKIHVVLGVIDPLC